MSEDWLQEIYDSLKGKYKHYCADFDDLPVDEFSVEWGYCSCYRPEELDEDARERQKLKWEDHIK